MVRLHILLPCRRQAGCGDPVVDVLRMLSPIMRLIGMESSCYYVGTLAKLREKYNKLTQWPKQNL